VTEDRLYQQIRGKIEEDFAPVKPLKEPWKRALWIFPLLLLLAGAILAVFHLRPDASNFTPLELYGFIVLQVAVCYLLLSAVLKTGIPGSFLSLSSLALPGVTAAAVFLAASHVLHRASPNNPPAGQEISMGAACIAIVGILGAASLVGGFFLARRGLPFRSGAAGLLLGLCGGLAVEAVWRLHCPFTSWSHVLVFHAGAVLILAFSGAVFGYLSKQKNHGG
jgi:hypothetical protein